ncbi:MAG: T9SS type A sorting domain-containing protein [Lentimicrobiaceae bacterium]|nr:T9SS type A sorting domain-containing protein [Lentimicrobiaceae bacterium]
MKRNLLFLLMTFLLCIGSSAFNDIKAQTTESTVTINANSTNSTSSYTQCYPVRCGHSVSISQQYYTKSEIGYGKGNITKIAFEGNNSSKAQIRSIKVYIKNIDSDNPSFSNDGNMIQLSENDLYFSGDFSVTNCSGSTAWNTIELDKSFSYDGNNILVCVNDATCSKGSDYYFTTYSCENRSVYQSIYSSTTPYNPTTSAIAHKNPTGYNPAIQFTFEEQSQDPITLIPSSYGITTCESVTFTVMQGEGTGTDVTTSATIYQVNGTETIELDGNTFTPSEAGEYTFYAKKGSVQSENIIINVTEAPYVLTASPTNIMADGEDITTFSVTQCGNTVEGFTFYVDGNERDGNTFSTAELGEYTVYATNGDITTSEITIYATEWKVTGWVTDLVLTEYYNTNEYGNKMSRKYENVAEITNGVFTLWLAITGTDLDNGIILNNNVYEYEIGTGGSAYMERSGHRPTTPQPLSIPGTLYIENIGEVTITEIANNVFYNTFIGDETGSYQATGNSLNDNISSLTIPSTITTLGINAFGFDMSDNFVITCNAETPPTIKNEEVNDSEWQTSFGNYSNSNPGNYGGKYIQNENEENISTYLYVPASSLTAYQKADFWKYFYRLVADPGSMIVYNGDGDWEEEENWSNGKVPADDEIVIINGNVEVSSDVTIKDITINKDCSITIVESGIFHINGTVTNNSENIITIEDGGQLYYNGEDELTVTVEKNIAGYGDDDYVKDGWYTISSPVYSVEDMETYGGIPYYYTEIANVTNLIPSSDNYDLYRYYEPGKTMEVGWWENYKQGESQLDEMLPDFTILSNGHGYLYASSKEVNLEFTGKVLTGSITHHCYKMNQNEDFNGFNLMGNPFTHDITLDNVTGLEMASGFYTVTNAGTWESHASTDNIKPTQGMLIKITDTSIDEDGLGFITIAEETIAEESETRSRSNNSGSITIKVSNDRYTDNAIVSFSEGKGLNKFPHLNKEAHEVYVIDNETKYGVATMNDDVTTIPVGFKANTMGQYTIAAEAKDCKFNSMTLIDNMTGVKTNLLTDSYTFMATTNDNPNRFTLTLNADNDTDNDFIYINNNEMIINNIEGDGLVQIYDVMGRSVATYNVSGSANISMETLSEGVYIVRMIDANGVKTQKVVNN